MYIVKGISNNGPEYTVIPASLRTCNTDLAGREPSAGNPLIRDFILVERKLSMLSFIHNKADGLILEGFGDEISE